MTRRKKLGFSLLALLLSLTVVELVSRAAVDRRLVPVVEMPRSGGWAQADARVGFVLIPGDYDGTHINGLGLRGPEVQLDKKPECRRILMVGGSTTYGNTVKTEEAYPAVAQRLLTAAEPSRCVEVINAGISGAHSGHQLARYRHIYRALKPDVVTLYIAWNDYGTYLWMMDDWEPETLAAQSLVVDLAPTSLAMLRASAALQIGYGAYKTTLFRRNLSRVANSPDPADALSKPTNALKSHLTALIELVRSTGAQVLLVKFPFVLDDTRVSQEARELQSLPDSGRFKQMLPLVSFTPSVPTIVAAMYDELAKQPGVSTVDCAAPFRSVPLVRRVQLFDDVIHPNAEGYRMLGSCVAEALEERQAGTH